jgi:hypothetical protein
MASGAEYFLKKTLGEDFLESLDKVELWKPGTKSTTDHEEIRTALQIVPRTIMALLVRDLSQMMVGQNKAVPLPVAGGAVLYITKHERDVYSGEIVEGSKKLTEFKFRSLPGVGLVIMSTFELYDMENLINSPNTPAIPENPKEDLSEKVQKLIDDRLALHDLIGKVVDKKIMERDAIHQLVLRKLTEMTEDHRKIVEITKIQEESTKNSGEEYHRGMTNGMKVVESVVTGKEPNFIEPPKDTSPPKQERVEKSEKKKRPLTEFLEKAKKKHEYSVVMTKGEQVHCPDCGKNIFDGKAFSGCVCLGDDMERKVFIKKNEDGINVRFSKGWDEENIEMLLEVLRKRHG